MSKSMRAQFAMVKKDYDNNIIFIEDIANHTGGCTITNDAEAVYRHIDLTYSHDAPSPYYWRVVYKDTNNEWWEMKKVVGWGDGEAYMAFEKWHGHMWDKLRGNV